MHVVFSMDSGGTERVITRVAQALNPAHWRIRVCCLERRGYLADQMPDPAGVYVLDKKPGKSVLAAIRLMRLLNQVKPDLLHTHNLGPLIYGVMASFGGIRCPILHGEHVQLMDNSLRPRRLRFRKFLYGSVKKIHTVSTEQRNQLIALGFPSQKIIAIVNGVDTNLFCPADKAAAKERLHLPVDATVIGTVAQLSPNKRHRLLIEAITHLDPRQRGIHVLFAGEGPERSALEADVEHAGLASNIHLLGFLPDPKPCLAAMDLLVMPGRAEGLSNAVLEAMACGIPVLAHTACGNAEVIADGENGWLAALDSAENLAEHIRQCLMNREALHKAGQAARQTIQTKFDFANTVQGYEALYREIAGRG